MYISIYLYIYIYIYNVVRMRTDLLWLNATYIVIENRSRCQLGYKPYEHRKIESRSVFNMQHTIQQEQSSRSTSGATPRMHRPHLPRGNQTLAQVRANSCLSTASREAPTPALSARTSPGAFNRAGEHRGRSINDCTSATNLASSRQKSKALLSPGVELQLQ